MSSRTPGSFNARLLMLPGLVLFVFVCVLALASGMSGAGASSPGGPAAGSPALTGTVTPTPTCGAYSSCNVASTTATVVPGTVDTGNHCDDCFTSITLPFPFTLYDQTFTSAQVSSNGPLVFGQGSLWEWVCLPATGWQYTIFPFSGDLTTANMGYGVFTSMTGSAPNRIFNIEWRAQYYPGTGYANFEVRLYEAGAGSGRFDIIYGTDVTTTVGVQKDDNLFTQCACSGNVSAGTLLTFNAPCPAATPTITPTPSCGTELVAPYPVPIADSAVTAVNGRLYSFGGLSNGAVTAASYSYDPSTNTWTALASMPAARQAAAAVAASGRVYVEGGRGTDGNAHSNVYVYDLASNSWTVGPSFQVPTWGQALATLNGSLYRIVGATGPNGYTNTVEGPGPGGYVAFYPHFAGYVQVVTYGGYIYAAGGYNGDYTLVKSYRYNPATDTWDDQAVSDLSIPVYAGASAIVDGKWVIAGGYVGGVASDMILSLDMSNPTGEWHIEPVHLAQPRSNAGGAAIGSLMYLVGGLPPYGGNTGTTEVQRVNLVPCGSPTPTTTPPTSTPTYTPLPTETGVPIVTPCAVTFADVGPPFDVWVRCLACRGIVGGYPCGGPGEPCDPEQHPYFRPYNSVTRGQLSKIVANSAGFNEPPVGQMFTDVPPDSAFYPYVQRMATRGIIGGYPCGGPYEPCDPENRPYFRPNNNVTRSQMAKIVSNSAGWQDEIPPDRQTFADVLPSHPFWLWIERAALHGVMAGYPCGGTGEPCDPQNRAYFRPYNASTRGQAAKVDTLAFFPECH